MAPRSKPRTKLSDNLKNFNQKFPGFKKKAIELSVLCGNSVGFICYGPDNDLHIFPESPQDLSQLVSKFNGLTDEKRKKNGCDLNDFPDLKDLSVEELRNHLSTIDYQLQGIKQKKISIKCGDHRREEIIPRVSSQVDHKSEPPNQLRVSNDDHHELGFGDELGYMLSGFTGLDGTASSALEISDLLDLTPLEEADSLLTSNIDDNWGFFVGDDDCHNNILSAFETEPFMWDSCQDELLVDVDSLMTNNNTDYWGFGIGQDCLNNLCGFQAQPFLLDSLHFAPL